MMQEIQRARTVQRQQHEQVLTEQALQEREEFERVLNWQREQVSRQWFGTNIYTYTWLTAHRCP